MKYLRISMLVGVPEDVENEVVEDDIRELVQDEMSEDAINSMTYRMVVAEIAVTGDETK